MNRPRPALAAIKSGYRMNAVDNRAEVLLYGVIGDWWDGVDAAAFVRELATLDVDTIDLRVNSPGGVALDGVAIMNALARHPARVVATVDGLAASAATIVLMAADEVVMGRGAELMIHDAWTIAMGSAAELHRDADSLDKTSQTIASLYADRAGGSEDDWRTAMLAETWYSDSEAVTAGLADRIAEVKPSSDSGATEVAALARVVGFAHAGRQQAPAPYIPARDGHPAAAGPRPTPTSAMQALATLTGAATEPPAPPVDTHSPTGREGGLMPDLAKGLRERLGIPADQELNDEQMLAAIDEALAEQVEPTVTAASLPEGVVTIDAETLASLRSDAAAGREARTVQETATRAALVDAAVQDGRIAPVRRDHWVSALEADPGAADTLAALTPGLIPLEAEGFVGGVDEANDEDQGLYARAWGADETKGA